MSKSVFRQRVRVLVFADVVSLEGTLPQVRVKTKGNEWRVRLTVRYLSRANGGKKEEKTDYGEARDTLSA